MLKRKLTVSRVAIGVATTIGLIASSFGAATGPVRAAG
ncbi:MAG: hypothetical protein JWO59_1758, partial [Chloroflexi bacterium]|nr:hypothetical protein [Chloroflexota bacterium]